MPGKSLIIILITLIFFPFTAEGAFEPRGHGSSFLASGGGGIALNDEAFAVFNNPAQIYHIKSLQTDLFYRNYFGLAELNQISLAAGINIMNQPLAFGISRFGNKVYAETEIRIGSAFTLFEQFHIGATFNVYHLNIKGYGNAVAYSLGLAGAYNITEKLQSAFVVQNVTEPTIGEAKEKLPLQMTLAFAYQPVPRFLLHLDMVKETEYSFDYRFGARFRIVPAFSILAGFRDLTDALCGGFILRHQRFAFMYGIEYHPQLGSTNTISFSYAL